MHRVWYVGGDMTEPEETTCEALGWPNLDAQGRTMYDNSHYSDLAAAWDSLLRERKAHVSLQTMSLRDLQAKVRRVTEATAQAACLWSEAQEKFEAWKRSQTAGEGEE